MNQYYNASICAKGHVIDKYNANRQKYCSICGSKVISICPNCNKPIRGPIMSNFFTEEEQTYIKPNYCYNCGEPYLWTQTILDNAVELISLDDDLDNETKNLIKASIPDLLVDSPSTPLATARYRKGIAKAGQILKNSLHNLLVDVVSETVRKTIFPS